MYVWHMRIEHCDWSIENIETAWPLRFQFVRAKLIFTLSKNIVYHAQQLYISVNLKHQNKWKPILVKIKWLDHETQFETVFFKKKQQSIIILWLTSFKFNKIPGSF